MLLPAFSALVSARQMRESISPRFQILTAACHRPRRVTETAIKSVGESDAGIGKYAYARHFLHLDPDSDLLADTFVPKRAHHCAQR